MEDGRDEGRDSAPRALALLKPVSRGELHLLLQVLRDEDEKTHFPKQSQNHELSRATVLFEGTGRWSGHLHSPSWVQVPIFW